MALAHGDGVEFAAALIGGWHAGRTVYLPGDTLPATCRALADRGIALAGEFPAEFAPMAAPADGDPAFAFAPLDGGVTGVVIHTSGSTGEPQALPKTLAQLAGEVETLEQQFGARCDGADVVATVSHQHIYGLLFKILWPLGAQRSFVSESVAYPEQLAVRLAARASVLVSSPAHLKRLSGAIDWSGARVTTRAIFSSGGPLPSEAVLAAEQLIGHTPIEVYGSSETGGVAWRQRTGGVERRWAPLPGVELRLQQGALSVRSPHVPGHDWFALADIVELGADGTFVLSGRADRIAKVEGKRVSLTAIERALRASPLVQDATLVALPGARDELGAVVVPTDAGRAALRDEGAAAVGRRLRAALAPTIERVALPRRWRWVDALPQNSEGKTPLASLMRLFEDGEPAVPPFDVVAQDGGSAVVVLCPSAALPCFDGHFPGAPVLAGVVQIEWAIALGRRLFGITGDFLRMEAVKFQRIFQPGPALRVELDWRADRAALRFQFSSVAGNHSSGRIFFTS